MYNIYNYFFFYLLQLYQLTKQKNVVMWFWFHIITIHISCF